jgi:hypothetical protein
MSAQHEELPIIAKYLVNLQSMIQQLTQEVEQIGSKLEALAVPVTINLPSAPEDLEISITFLASALGASKSTIERRITNKILPVPHTQPNGYRYWYKKELPKIFYSKIDAHYYQKNAVPPPPSGVGI